jgi:hypothetical protein
MEKSISGEAVVEDCVRTLAKGRCAELGQGKIQQPEPENITLVVADHCQAVAQQTLLLIYPLFTHPLFLSIIKG